MDPAPAVNLRALKGAPLSVLFALALEQPRTLGAGDLVTTTGYTPNTVTAALKALTAMGYVQNHNRYDGWGLTSVARQLPLWRYDSGPVQNPPSGSESQNLRLPARSSSKDIPHGEDSCAIDSFKLLLQEIESQNLRLPTPAVIALFSLLAGKIGIARARAFLVIAMHRDDPPRLVGHAVGWFDYATDRPSINNVPAFVGAKLVNREPAPSWLELSRWALQIQRDYLKALVPCLADPHVDDDEPAVTIEELPY